MVFTCGNESFLLFGSSCSPYSIITLKNSGIVVLNSLKELSFRLKPWPLVNAALIASDVWFFQGMSTVEIKPYLTNGFSHRYHLDESTFIFRGVRSDF